MQRLIEIGGGLLAGVHRFVETDSQRCVSAARKVVLWLRSLHRGYKFAMLMIAVWTLVLGTSHPLGVLLITGPAAALFLLSTTGQSATLPASEDTNANL